MDRHFFYYKYSPYKKKQLRIIIFSHFLHIYDTLLFMEKTYHFMAGLPRSGSSLLSAILNQNPNVYSSPQTDLLEMLYSLQTQIPSYESYRAGLLHENYARTMKGLADNFYSSVEKPIIIDKNRGWGTPHNFTELSGYLNGGGKVILTMRPILEVLASFIKVSRKNQKDTGILPYLDPTLWVSSYRSEVDAQVDNLMIPNGEIDRALFSIANLLKNHKNRVHVVWFDDLLTKPQATLDEIYGFLELNSFVHNFEEIQPAEKHNDLAGYGISGLHDVGKKIVRPHTKVERYLSDYLISKYGNTLDFLNF